MAFCYRLIHKCDMVVFDRSMSVTYSNRTSKSLVHIQKEKMGVWRCYGYPPIPANIAIIHAQRKAKTTIGITKVIIIPIIRRLVAIFLSSSLITMYPMIPPIIPRSNGTMYHAPVCFFTSLGMGGCSTPHFGQIFAFASISAPQFVQCFVGLEIIASPRYDPMLGLQI